MVKIAVGKIIKHLKYCC